MISKIKIPLLLVLALVLILAMLRLAVWQLDRAEQKSVILAQQQLQAEQAAVPLAELIPSLIAQASSSPNQAPYNEYRFTAVKVEGEFMADDTILIDNQVTGGKVGYQVITPLKIAGTDTAILVDRGWVSIGASRDQIPQITTPTKSVILQGRLNAAPAKPPLWDEQYPVSQGSVWAYLPVQDYAQQFQLKILPLVLELAPTSAHRGDLVVAWDEIDDKWVGKHKGYAFQWFAMALAFFVACLVLLLRRGTKKTH